jgi:very-short-patch-repair endonuclease
MTRKQKELFPELPVGKKYLSDYPNLLAEFHPTKNTKSPDDLAEGSHERVWWHCSVHEHDWETEVRLRTIRGSGCRYCAGYEASSDYNLAVLNPTLCKEWDYDKNEILPENCTPNSYYKVWWKCSKGHSWQTAIDSRSAPNDGLRSGCPYCAGKLATEENNLLVKFPKIAKEWSPRNQGKPEDFLPQSNKKVWWVCEKFHEYQTVITSRTNMNTGCPYCAGKKPSLEYNLAVTFPDLVKEWDFDHNDKTPSDYVPMSNKKVFWVCSRGHKWKTTIAHRTGNNRGCPKCSNQSSRNEIRILTEFMACFGKVEHRTKFDGYETDIFIPEVNVVIEYDGSYWHQDKQETDLKKTAHLNKLGFRVIRVRETPLPVLQEKDFLINKSEPIEKSVIEGLLAIISRDLATTENYRNASGFINDELYRSYIEAFPSPFPERSLTSVNPKLADEWHPTKNTPLSPLNFMPNSTYNAWWQCPNGHEYQQKIVRRNSQGASCNICKSLGWTHPEIAKMFHPTKNGDTSTFDITYGNNNQFVWQCLDFPEHEWVLTPKQMTGGGKVRKQKHCPYCRERKNDKNVPQRRA